MGAAVLSGYNNEDLISEKTSLDYEIYVNQCSTKKVQVRKRRVNGGI